MDPPNPGGVTITLDAGPQDGDGCVMPSMYVEIEVPNIKQECFEHFEDDHQTCGGIDVETVTTKEESGNPEEDGWVIPCTGLDIDQPDAEKECLEHPESITQIAAENNYQHNTRRTRGSAMDLPNPETVSIKTEPGSQEEGASETPCTVKGIDLPDEKEEWFERSESITRTADSITTLKTHPGRKSYSCSYCKYSCSRMGILKSHMFTHSGEKPYSCSDCSYSCIEKGNLSRHMRTHTGEKPYSCSYCKYTFKEKIALTRHIITHTGEKPYSCSYCHYSSSRKGNLKSHMLTHSGEKPFLCSYCSYACSRKVSLKNHLVIHSGKKPYSCSDCNYSCIQKRNLIHHMFTHTGDKPYSCSYCKYTCAEKGYLKRHMLTHAE